MDWLTLSLFLIVTSVCSVTAQAPKDLLDGGWKGIKVFESTRAHVEKLLGKPTKVENGDFWYETSEARYRFVFSYDPCSAPDTLVGGFKVKAGVVLEYEVRPTKIITIGDLGIDLNIYKRSDPFHALNFSHYDNRAAGIYIEALVMSEPHKEFVQMIYFWHTLEQNARYSCRKSK